VFDPLPHSVSFPSQTSISFAIERCVSDREQTCCSFQSNLKCSSPLRPSYRPFSVLEASDMLMDFFPPSVFKLPALSLSQDSTNLLQRFIWCDQERVCFFFSPFFFQLPWPSPVPFRPAFFLTPFDGYDPSPPLLPGRRGSTFHPVFSHYPVPDNTFVLQLVSFPSRRLFLTSFIWSLFESWRSFPVEDLCPLSVHLIPTPPSLERPMGPF